MEIIPSKYERDINFKKILYNFMQKIKKDDLFFCKNEIFEGLFIFFLLFIINNEVLLLNGFNFYKLNIFSGVSIIFFNI